MITGIEVFREFFKDFKEQYVLIGGAACDLIFNDINSDFRVTKDLDIVIIVEALTPEFGKRVWDFINAGGYEHREKSNGSPQFFRFDKPKSAEFPYMIELFARTDQVLRDDSNCCTPLYLGEEVSSLSAILLNDDYYQMLNSGKVHISDVVLLSEVYLIPFKAKAWLDLTRRKIEGKPSDEKDIKKHKNDIVRLTAILTGNESCILPNEVRTDMAKFIQEFEISPIDPKLLNIIGIKSSDIIDVLKAVYLDLK